jgi:hypothetical protein
MFLSVITVPIVLALLINFLNRRCNVRFKIQDMNTSAPILLAL